MPDWTLLEADALEALAGLPEGAADLLVTDPPFTAAGGSTNGRSAGHSADDQFFRHWFAAIMAECTRVVRPDGCAFICCDWRTSDAIRTCVRGRGTSQTSKQWEVTQMLVWDRGSIGLGSPFRNQFELIAFARGPDFDRGDRPRNVSNVLAVPWPYGSHTNHPAEKPTGLFRPLLEMGAWGHPGATVLDPFAGSGSAGVACAGAGLSYIGIEHDEAYAAVARERLGIAFKAGAVAPPRPPQAQLFGATP